MNYLNSQSSSRNIKEYSLKEVQSKPTKRLIQNNEQSKESNELLQNELISKISERYQEAMQIIEIEQNKLYTMVAFMESYKVTGLRDKDLQKLKEDLKNF